jgi:2'-5' RNA ligase
MTETTMSQPLILTLQLDPFAQTFYENLRRRHFPPERNLIPAHLTLFHQLPDKDSTYTTVRELAESTPILQLAHNTPRSIGRGVAIFFQSEQLASLHSALSRVFKDQLIPQDRQPFRPHIVIQNKVDPETASATLSELDVHSLAPPNGIGLTLWRYLGGPWKPLSDFPFMASTTDVAIEATADPLNQPVDKPVD